MMHDANQRNAFSSVHDRGEHKIRIKFETNDQSLFDLAYIALDLNQLIVFSELINDKNYKAAHQLFLEPGHYPLTRQNKILNEYSSKIKVDSIQNGCINIVISGISILSQVILAYLGIAIPRYLDKKNERIKFNISPEDKALNDLINDYESGKYGKDEQDFQWFIRDLSHRGYNIELSGEDIYIIENITKKYKTRIVKTIRKH